MEILYEDNHLIAVNKSNSDIIQGDKTGDTPMSEKVKEYLKITYKKPGNVFVGVPHRLDRPTSGVVLFTKTSKALGRMGELFSQGKIKKTYWAVVDKPPPEKEGQLVHYLVRNREQNKSYAFDREVENAKKAALTYKLIGKSDNYYLLEIDLLTGRHHQIRAQLSEIGCRIKGDLKYGFPRSNKNAGIHLHAREIAFIHPVKNIALKITANPPDDALWNFFSERFTQ
jgi:23S rRNA pseudouridine1911/1915/1917 synthase